jgi:hypothetical protein
MRLMLLGILEALPAMAAQAGQAVDFTANCGTCEGYSATAMG